MHTLSPRIAFIFIPAALACGDGAGPSTGSTQDAGALGDAAAMVSADAATPVDASAAPSDCMRPNDTCATGESARCDLLDAVPIARCPTENRQGACVVQPDGGFTLFYYAPPSGAPWSDPFFDSAKEECEFAFRGVYSEL